AGHGRRAARFVCRRSVAFCRMGGYRQGDTVVGTENELLWPPLGLPFADDLVVDIGERALKPDQIEPVVADNGEEADNRDDRFENRDPGLWWRAWRRHRNFLLAACSFMGAIGRGRPRSQPPCQTASSIFRDAPSSAPVPRRGNQISPRRKTYGCA